MQGGTQVQLEKKQKYSQFKHEHTSTVELGLSDNRDINHIAIKIHYRDHDIIDRLSR